MGDAPILVVGDAPILVMGDAPILVGEDGQIAHPTQCVTLALRYDIW